jgi:hypothetical protein
MQRYLPYVKRQARNVAGALYFLYSPRRKDRVHDSFPDVLSALPWRSLREKKYKSRGNVAASLASFGGFSSVCSPDEAQP